MNSRRYPIEYGPSAIEDLDRLPARERAEALRRIERLQSGLQGNLKRLQRSHAMYRLLMDDCRVLVEVAGGVIVIRRIGHRNNAYD
jgi:mRNA-degrading endonuclease RelE of RelBE toxin-antitoxin system